MYPVVLKSLNFRILESTNPVKVLVFDLDNTLIDRDEAFRLCLQQLFVSQEKEELFKTYWIEIENRDNRGYTNRQVFCEWLQQRFEFGISAEAIWQYCLKHIADFVPESSKELMDWLKDLKKDYTLALLTNGGSENQRRKLKNSTLDKVFDADKIFISAEIGFHKPDKRIFEYVQAQLNFKEQEFLMIGNDPINDIEGAAKAGWGSYQIFEKHYGA